MKKKLAGWRCILPLWISIMPIFAKLGSAQSTAVRKTLYVRHMNTAEVRRSNPATEPTIREVPGSNEEMGKW